MNPKDLEIGKVYLWQLGVKGMGYFVFYRGQELRGCVQYHIFQLPLGSNVNLILLPNKSVEQQIELG